MNSQKAHQCNEIFFIFLFLDAPLLLPLSYLVSLFFYFYLGLFAVDCFFLELIPKPTVKTASHLT